MRDETGVRGGETRAQRECRAQRAMPLLRSFRCFALPDSGGWHPRLHYAAPPELRGFCAIVSGPLRTRLLHVGPSGPENRGLAPGG
jgi:hypothetical protein